MSNIVKILKLFHPITFAIMFLVIFSAIVYYVDLKLSEEKLETTITQLSQSIDNYIVKELGNKYDNLLRDSLVKYRFIDTTATINILGINSKDTTAKIPDLIVGYMKVIYNSDTAYNEDFVNYSKIILGTIKGIEYQKQIHRNPNGILVYPHYVITSVKNENLENKIMDFMVDNTNIFDQYNKGKVGSKITLFLNTTDFGTGKLYIPIVSPSVRRITKLNPDTKKNEAQSYINLLRYAMIPLDYFMAGLLKHNIDITIKDKVSNNYFYGDEIITKKLLNKTHSKQIIVTVNQGNDFIVTFAPNSSFAKEWTFFPIVYIILIIISILFHITLWFFLKQIKQHEIILEKSNVALQLANSTKDKFFSIIAHDLRNPIAAMLNISSVFYEYYQTMSIEEANNAIKMLIKSTSHIAKTLENLLQWSRVNMDTINFNPVSVKISEIINSSFNDVSNQATEKNVSLKFELKENIDTFVYCDTDMINTTLRNLISNAIKFSDKEKQVNVTVNNYAEDDKYIVVSVSDNGVGINSETLSKLFRIDNKISTYGTAGEAGTGLGLILCKEFIDKHNCKIWVESELGVGTDFKFTLLKSVNI